MKKLKLVTAAMTALMATSTTASVLAADAPAPAFSTGHAILTQDDSVTDPTDPTDPPTGNAGPLSLDTVPTYDFGTQPLTGGDTLFDNPTVLGADGKYSAKDGHVQVTDKRGTGAGWIVSVKYVGDAKGAATTTDEAWASADGLHIKGAELELPAAAWSDAKGATNNAPGTSTGITVTATDQDIAKADKDQGLGTWVGTFAQSAVKLTVPQGNKVGDYTANLQWTLTDAAQA